jgi:hypothetical protein
MWKQAADANILDEEGRSNTRLKKAASYLLISAKYNYIDIINLNGTGKACNTHEERNAYIFLRGSQNEEGNDEDVNVGEKIILKRSYRHLWADWLDNVGSLTSHKPIGLHSLLRG